MTARRETYRRQCKQYRTRRDIKFDVERKRLKELIAKYPASKIADMYGVAKSTVMGRAATLGLKWPKRGNGMVQRFKIPRWELRTLYCSKRQSLEQIAIRYGCGISTIKRRMKQYGIKLRSPHAESLRHLSVDARANRHDHDILARRTSAVVMWRRRAIARTDSTCESCGRQLGCNCSSCGQRVKIYVHHIKPWATHPKLRLDDSNSRVLCESCHRQLKGNTG